MTVAEDKLTPANPWPDGYTQLTTDEARDAILFGQHKGPASMKVDAASLALLERGSMVCARQPDGDLAIQATMAALNGTDLKED
jgi:hypothetical protein